MLSALLTSTNLLANDFINNNIIKNEDKGEVHLRNPHFSELSNLKKNTSNFIDELRNFETKDHSIINIRKDKYEFYHDKKWSPPKIATYSYQNFGIWDAAFLWYMLDNNTDNKYSLFFHHHQNNSGIKLFESEVKRFSNIDPKYKNMLYRAKQNKFLEKEDEKYLPPQITSTIALFEDVLHYNVDSETDNLRIASNLDGYDISRNSCEKWNKSNYISLKVKCPQHKDSEARINSFVNGYIDSTIIQSDELYVMNKENPILKKYQGVRLGKEAIFFLVNKNANIYKLSDLEKTDKKIITLSLSAKNTLKMLGDKIPELKKTFNNVSIVSNSEPLLKRLLIERAPIIVFSCDYNNCPQLDIVNERVDRDYEMLPINFWQILNDRDQMGNPIYTQTKIPYKYENIQNPDIYQKNNVKHISIYNYLIITDFWFEHHRDYIRELEEFLKNL